MTVKKRGKVTQRAQPMFVVLWCVCVRNMAWHGMAFFSTKNHLKKIIYHMEYFPQTTKTNVTKLFFFKILFKKLEKKEIFQPQIQTKKTCCCCCIVFKRVSFNSINSFQNHSHKKGQKDSPNCPSFQCPPLVQKTRGRTLISGTTKFHKKTGKSRLCPSVPMSRDVLKHSLVCIL